MEKLWIDLKGKVIVITGGGGILCSFIAKSLARYGAKIAIVDINLESAKKVEKDILEKNGSALAIKADVLDKDNLQKATEKIIEEWGKINILINGAGGNHPRATTSHEFLTEHDLSKTDNDITNFFDLNLDGVKFVFNLNFLGTFLSSQVFGEKIIDQENPVIINISSMNSYRPLTKIPAYSAAKASVSNFTQWLAVYLAKMGIRVNAIAPGFFLTEQNKPLLIDQNGNFNDRAKKILEHTPMGRFGNPKDLLGTLLWLLDEKASGFVTGIVIPVDGGFSAYSGV